MLEEPQRRALLGVARAAIQASITGLGDVALDGPEMPDAAGVFVTIKRHGELRGCLGTLDNRLGLAGEVARCAADAATRDPRFPPLAPEELHELAVEISVLGALEIVDAVAPDAFRIGEHGLMVERGRRRGLLLPQVATEWGWTPEQFLCQTCRKAGLPEDAWRRGATVYRFRAVVFGE